jgi:hypothetical protein
MNMNTQTDNAFKSTIGRTVERVEYARGPRPRRGDSQVHQWEYARFYFADGSMLDVSTGSNAAQVAEGHPRLKASDFGADLDAKFYTNAASAPRPS